MRARMLWMVMALVLAAALISIASAPASADRPVMNSGLKNIRSGQYVVVKDFIAKADASVSYQLQVVNPQDAAVDILLMDRQNFEHYKSGEAFDYLSVSGLNVNSAFEDGAVILIAGTEYFLVIDNSNRPIGGAPGSAEVQVIYGFMGTNVQSVTDGVIILIIIAIVAVAAVAIVFLGFFLLRRLKGEGQFAAPSMPGQTGQQPWMKRCLGCGMEASTEFAYCPRCGNRY